MGERENLERAISALEAQRETLGDQVVEDALRPLHERLAALLAHERLGDQQRKLATLLLTDVSGFTALSERLDAEVISDTMNALWERIDTVIVKHGGMIDKHIGDAVMAVWGAERAQEDDPERAVRAALAMKAALADFRDEYDVPLTMRVGINTGPVVLGTVGTTGEFSAMGDAVNLAKRLEMVAPTDGILISHDTYRHVRGIFDVMPRDPVAVKGKADPVRTYVVMRSKPRAFHTRTRGVEGIETRMVGRDAQLMALQNTFGDVVAGAGTRQLIIAGEAGIGKSRLLEEFEEWIDLQPVDVWYFKGRARPALQRISYGVIRDMLSYRFQIRETDSAATVLAKFRSGTAGVLHPDQADLVGHAIGYDFSASRAVRKLLGSPSFGRQAAAYLRRFFRTMAERPMVMFLEDTHWADDSTLDLVDELVAELPRARMLAVCLARPPLFQRRPEWAPSQVPSVSDDDAKLENGRQRTLLQLSPLSEGDSSTLVDEILQKVERVPDTLRELVVKGAEGNPFYVEELIKRLIEDGVIIRGDERWRIAPDRLTSVHVPATLTGVLQARLDSLPRDEKDILQRASVVGRTFWDDAVAALNGEADAAGLGTRLADLCERELIYRREPSTFGGTHEYTFKHAILRDVTYETVLLKRRHVYHGQVARWLEANAGERLDEFLGLVAGHYERAGERAAAADYYRRYGEELHTVSTYREAIAAFEQALELLPEGDAPTRAPVLVSLGNAYHRIGDYPAALDRFERGMRRAREVGDRRSEVTALSGMGLTQRVQGKHHDAERHLQESLALARRIRDRLGMAVALYNLGDAAFRRGDADDAQRYAEESLAIAHAMGERQASTHALRVLGFAALLRREWAAAERRYRESLEICSDRGDRRGVASCLINLGELARKQGDWEEAARHLEESLEISADLGARHEVAICHNNLGHVYIGLGRSDAARDSLCEALKAARALGVTPIALEALVGMAALRSADGEWEGAAELLGLVMAHPSFNDETQQYASPVLADLRANVPLPRLEDALERGRAAELATVVSGIVG